MRHDYGTTSVYKEQVNCCVLKQPFFEGVQHQKLFPKNLELPSLTCYYCHYFKISGMTPQHKKSASHGLITLLIRGQFLRKVISPLLIWCKAFPQCSIVCALPGCMHVPPYNFDGGAGGSNLRAKQLIYVYCMYMHLLLENAGCHELTIESCRTCISDDSLMSHGSHERGMSHSWRIRHDKVHVALRC